jgi:6-methylsalicylate decarboxylase
MRMSSRPPDGASNAAAGPVFDLHQHLWPEPFTALLRARTDPPSLRGGVLTTLEGSFPVDLSVHDPHRRVEDLDRAGIDVAVVSLQTTLGVEAVPAAERAELFDAYNTGVSEVVTRSDGRLRALSAGSYVPGHAGLCLGASQLLETASLHALLDPLERAGGFLFVHPDRVEPPPEGAPAWWAAVTGYTAEMQAAYFAWIETGASRWPELPVVFSLLAGGAAFQLDRLRSRGVATRRFTEAPIYLETSSYTRPAVELSIAAFGIDRIVHGSDYPVIDPDRTLAALAGLGRHAFEVVTTANPQVLLAEAACEHDYLPMNVAASMSG